MKRGDMHNRADGRQWDAFMRHAARLGNPVQTGISKFHSGIWCNEEKGGWIGCSSHVVLVFSVRWRPAKIIEHGEKCFGQCDKAIQER